MRRFAVIALTITFVVLAPALFFGGAIAGLSSPFDPSRSILPEEAAFLIMIAGVILAFPTSASVMLLQDFPGSITVAYLLHLPWSYFLARVSLKVYDALMRRKVSHSKFGS